MDTMCALKNRLSPQVVAAMCVWIAAPPAAGQRLSITEIWSTTGSAAVHEMGYVAGVAELGNTSVWVSEGLGKAALIALNAEGRSPRIVARAGSGPGEVGGPTLIARTAAGGLAVLDVSHLAVQVFDASGRFVERVPLSARVHNPKGFAALRSGQFVVSGGIPRNDYSLHLFGSDGTLITSWHRAPRTRDPWAGVMVAGGPVYETKDGSILFSQAAPHAIIRFARPGGQPRVLSSDPALLQPVGDDFIRTSGSGMQRQRRFQWFFPQSRAVFELPNGNIVNVVWFLDRGTSVWELYSPTGRRLARQEIARAYEPWSLAANGDILASYRDDDTDVHRVTRLRINVR